jgi:hypothetical protein
VPFGAYVHSHEMHDNTMQPRTTGAIYLGPSGNEQGTHYFYSLTTGRMLSWPSFTELPMPKHIIQCLSDMSQNHNMHNSLTFGNCLGQEIQDETDDIDNLHDKDYMDSDQEDIDGDSISYATMSSQPDLDYDNQCELEDDSRNYYEVPTDEHDSIEHDTPLTLPTVDSTEYNVSVNQDTVHENIGTGHVQEYNNNGHDNVSHEQIAAVDDDDS